MTTTTHKESAGMGLTTDTLRRAGWTFVASFAVFVVAIVLTALNVNRVEAEDDAAKALDVSIHDLPGDVMSRIANERSSVLTELATSTLPSVLAFGLLLLGIWWCTRGFGSLGVVGRAAAAATLVSYAACMSLFLALYAGPDDLPWAHDNFPGLVRLTVAAAVMTGSVAVLVLVARLRSEGIARRTGLIVGAIAALALVATPIPAVGGMPPILPCLLAMVLGIVMIRTRSES